MLATGGVILTSAGALMISRSLELVKPIEFTHMKIGTGDISSLDNARALTDLVASYMTINMSSIARNENTIRIRGSFTNESFSSEVTIKEIGVFAKIGAEQSVLFGYVNDGQGEVIPPGNSGNVISRTRDLYIGVTSEAEAVITIDKSLVYPTIEDLEEGLNQKENKFNKNSGFNKTKSDATNLKDSETLATSMAVAKTMEKAEEALNSAGGKEPAFNKNTAFNKNFGTGQNEILEGSKLAEILGIEYGGVLNNTNTKVAGKGYYDTANKKIYKCTTNTSINYADAGYFIEVSNNDLLGKLQNLYTNNYMILFPGCVIWRFGNICGMQLTNVFTSPPDNTWSKSNTGGAYQAFTYSKAFEFPSWFKLPSNEIGLSFTSSDRHLMGELMIRPSSLQFFVVNLNSSNIEPLDTQFSLSGTSVWAL